jgi:hypothetical protein
VTDTLKTALSKKNIQKYEAASLSFQVFEREEQQVEETGHECANEGEG